MVPNPLLYTIAQHYRKIVENKFGCSAATIPTASVMRDVNNTKNKKYQHCFTAVGSVYQFTRPGDVVWGPGLHVTFRNQFIRYDPTPRNFTLVGVRGPRTEQWIKKDMPMLAPNADPNVLPESLPKGDPGSLIPRLFPSVCDAATMITKKTKFCLMPHYSHYAHLENYTQTMKLPFALIPPNGRDWQAVVGDICHCEYLTSSSLHGIILAEAFGIPAVWIPSGENKFKYLDYYEGLPSRANMTGPYLGPLDDLVNTSMYPQPIPPAEHHAYTQGILDSFPYQFFRTVPRQEETSPSK